MELNNAYFSMPMNMDKVCRICLMENADLRPIFCNRQIVDNLTFSQKIQLCGGVDCQEHDGLPVLICGVCEYKANIAFEFRQLCQHSDARLRMYFNKPAKFNSATDSCTQTDLQVQAYLTNKSTEELQNSYYVKEEDVINSQQFHNSLASGEYHPESQTNTVVTTLGSSISTVNVNIAGPDEKLFVCPLGFEDQSKDISKNTVNCTQELIPVSANLIEGVCNIGTAISAENGAKNNVSYFNYLTKDQTLQKNDSDDKSKNNQSNDFNSEEISYFADNAESNQTEEEGAKYKCNLCPKVCSTQSGFKKHQAAHEKQVKCDVCFKAFCKIENLEKHKVIHEKKPHGCRLCHMGFKKQETLIKHLKSHADKGENVEQLSMIDNDLKNEPEVDDVKNESAETDVSKSEGSDDEEENDNNGNEPGNEPGNGSKNPPKTVTFECEVCGQKCATKKTLKRHSIIHGEKKYSCTVCKKWFFRADTLKKHAEKHGHGLLDNIFYSNRLYESDDDARPSVNNEVKAENDGSKNQGSEEENNGIYKCQHCDKKLSSKKGLRRHVAMHKPKPEPAVCHICGKVCASRARLALHQKTHNKPKDKVPKEYLCHICSKVYPSNSSLTYHMRTHTGVKPHVCQICKSGFTTTTSLANHIRIHTGDRPFVCHVCSAAFAVSSAFRRHLTRHTGEANYHCKTCGKAFKRLSTLKEHTYTHSGEKPYVCKTCGAAYSHSGSLFAHQKRCRVVAQFAEMVGEDTESCAINVQSPDRSLAVINQQMF